MLALTQPADDADGAALPPAAERRDLVVKFFDYLEANAEEYWEVPTLDLVEGGSRMKRRKKTFTGPPTRT